MDIVGGRGSLLATILRANPHLRGILFDLPQVIAGARHEAALNDPTIASRRSFVGGQLLRGTPRDGRQRYDEVGPPRLE